MQTGDERRWRQQPGAVDVEKIDIIRHDDATDGASQSLEIKRVFCKFTERLSSIRIAAALENIDRKPQAAHGARERSFNRQRRSNLPSAIHETRQEIKQATLAAAQIRELVKTQDVHDEVDIVRDRKSCTPNLGALALPAQFQHQRLTVDYYQASLPVRTLGTVVHRISKYNVIDQ